MSSKDILVSLLSKTELFKGLAVEDIEACIPSFREAKFKKGQALFTRGERATGLYLVAEGRVRLAIATEDGRELSFRHATSGELLGEIAALDGGTRSADATALTAVTTYRLDKEDFRKLWTARPVLAERLISFLCSRLRDTSEAGYRLFIRAYLVPKLGHIKLSELRAQQIETAYTEILQERAALGAADRLVAVDTFSDYPAEGQLGK